MTILLGVFLFCLGIQRASIWVLAIPAVLAVALTGLHKAKHIELGDKLIWIPLLGIVLVTLIGGSIWQSKVFMCLMFTIYLAGVNIGWRAFRATDWLVVIATISVIVTFAISGGERTGGLFSETNYNIATGVIALCTVVSRRWYIYPTGMLGLFFTGAVEGLIAICGLLLILLLTRQWKVLAVCLAVALIALAVLSPTKVLDRVQDRADLDFSGRYNAMEKAVEDTSLLGHEYKPFELDGSDIHNVPLLVLDQIGIIGALLWLWVLGYGLLRSRAKGIWLIIGLLSIFDNYVWAQLGMWYWYLAGSTQVYSKSSEFS